MPLPPDFVVDDIGVQAVPEPASMAALGLGALGGSREKRVLDQPDAGAAVDALEQQRRLGGLVERRHPVDVAGEVGEAVAFGQQQELAVAGKHVLEEHHAADLFDAGFTQTVVTDASGAVLPTAGRLPEV